MVKAVQGFVSGYLPFVAIFLFLPASVSAQAPAQQVVNDAAAAVGGRERILAVRTLVLEGQGKEFSFGQGSNWSELGQEASVWKVLSYRRAYDLTAGRARFEQSRTPLYAFYAGHVPGKSVEGLDGDVARFTRSFNFKTVRVQPQLDLYNAFNANPVTGIVVRYGAAWQNATSVLNPRTVKFGVNMNF